MWNIALVLVLISLSFTSAAPYCTLKPSGSILASSPSSAPIKGATTSNNSNSTFLSTTWYAGWHGTDFPPENVSWSKYSSVTYSFAVTTADPSVITLADSDQQLLPRFVSLAHQNGVKALLSIGGWTGSQYYSTVVTSQDSRTTFAQTILGLVSQYNLDGIDFDWEYPNRQGIGCNAISPSDSANFLSLLQQLRSDPAGKNLTLSAAVSITPFVGSDGTPMSDVSQFAQELDYIEIMAYDIWGTWTPSGVGPNAPLNDTCATTKEGSAVSAIAAWTTAKFPSDQIVLGVPSYGHSFHVDSSAALQNGSTQLAAYPPFDPSQQPHGDSWDGAAGVDQCGNPTPVGGIFDFWGLVQGGFLTNNGTPADGISFRYDNCSQTPYVYNPSTQVMVSYDDAQSFAAKGQFITEANLLGFAMWEAGGDFDDILLDSIISSIEGDDGC